MGLDVYLYDAGESVEEVKSDKHPDHLCNKTYLRSSYNDAGFNKVVRDLTGKDLWWVFEEVLGGDDHNLPDTAYDGTPVNVKAWLTARSRAVELLNHLKECGNIRVCSHSPTNIFKPEAKSVDSEKALEIYREHLDSHANRESPYSYSNGKGLFLCEGDELTVHALINGKDALGQPTVHIIYSADISWYIEAAEVVVEFIDHALSMEEPGIVWSH